MPSIDLSATPLRLVRAATAQVAQCPQYTGHFASYRLVRVKRDIKTKRGLAFTRGEYAIATERRDELPGLPSSGKFITAWSRRHRMDINVRTTDVECL